MAQQPRNGNIMSFFKPAQRTTSNPQKSSPPSPPTKNKLSPRLPSPQPSPRLPSNQSSPRLPSLPASQPATPSPLAKKSKHNTPVKKLEVAASDDDDGDDSDGSLEDLSTLLGRGRPEPAKQSTPYRDPYATPRAKRIAVEFYSSPVAFMPKHKFDFKALANDARKDEATDLSSLRAKAAMVSEVAEDDMDTHQDQASNVVADVVQGRGGKDAQKVIRAMKRAEPTQSKPQYCFFNRDPAFKATSSKPPAVPKDSPWRLLTVSNARAREQCLGAGLLSTVLKKTPCGLPDELFLWVLDEICVEKSVLMRQEYSNLIINSPMQIPSLLTSEVMERLFLRLGATEASLDHASIVPISRPGDDPYEGRDWSCVESILVVLGLVADRLTAASARCALSILLQMAMDKVVMGKVEVLIAHQRAVESMIDSLPAAEWSSFCYDAATQLCTTVETRAIRMNALICLPLGNKKIQSLRRRLAIACLFDDPNLSRSQPDDIITVEKLTSRLNEDENVFSIRPDTNFGELKASVLLLDIALDDGSLGGHPSSIANEKDFNDDVDELADALRGVWRDINDTGMKLARTEAKGVIDWVEKRLSHSVRTRRKAKRDIYKVTEQKEDLFLPKQQDFMSQFLKTGSKA